MRIVNTICARTAAVRLGIASLFLLLLGGCAVGPHYSRPTATVPPAYKELPQNWKTAQPSDEITRGKWWEIFRDPQLNTLEEQINVSNQNIKAAEAQFRQARALVRYYRSNYYPTLTTSPSVTRSHSSSNRPPASTLSGKTFTDYLLPVELGGTLLLVATVGAIAIAYRRSTSSAAPGRPS